MDLLTTNIYGTSIGYAVYVLILDAKAGTPTIATILVSLPINMLYSLDNYFSESASFGDLEIVGGSCW